MSTGTSHSMYVIPRMRSPVCFGAAIDAAPACVRVRVLEDVERTLAIGNLYDETVTRPAIRDLDEHQAVALAPQQPDVGAIVAAMVELVEEIARALHAAIVRDFA